MGVYTGFILGLYCLYFEWEFILVLYHRYPVIYIVGGAFGSGGQTRERATCENVGN